MPFLSEMLTDVLFINADRAAQLLHQANDGWRTGFDLAMLNEHLNGACCEFIRRALKLDFRQYVRAEERATNERSPLIECLKMWGG